MKLHIYSPKITNRLRYTVKVMFSVVVHAEFEWHDDRLAFVRAAGAKLNYSDEPIDGVIQIKPSGLLAEKTLRRETGSTFKADPLSSIFYTISRYEEYLPFEEDAHGRFQAKATTADLSRATVHHLTINLCEQLKAKSGFQYELPSYSFEPTYDIDNAYAHLHKSAMITLGSLVKAVFTGGQLKEKIEVLLKRRQDPYDNYTYLEQLCRQSGIQPKIFMLTASGSPYDRNISPDSSAFSDLVKKLQSFSDIGIHPSYRSSKEARFPVSEKTRLEEITGKAVTASRQHFLKFRFPGTFERLTENGITDDYSIGYAEVTGFRSGMARPYPFFNLKTDKETNLILHPFQFMDSTYQFYHKKNPEEVKFILKELIAECRSVGGEFCPLWHNESLGNAGMWKGWRDLHDWMYENAKP